MKPRVRRQNMKIAMTVVKKDNECHFFADKFAKESDGDCLTAGPVTFDKVRFLFEEDGPHNTMLILPLEEAKKMAQEILKL